MSDDRKRIQVFPSPRALEILGVDTSERGVGAELSHAIECWADSMRRASAEVAERFSRQEWCLLADVLNGSWTLDRSWTGQVLALEVHDAQRLDGAGDRWFGDGEGSSKIPEMIARLQACSFEQAQAIILAVRWFWAHHESVDIQADEWWALKYRLRKQAQ